MKTNKLRFGRVFCVSLMLAFSNLGHAQSITELDGLILLDDPFGSSGTLNVRIQGSTLSASAEYPETMRSNYSYESLRDSFEGSISDQGAVEGEAVRVYRQTIASARADGTETIHAFVETTEIGNFQGRYRDGRLEVMGRFFRIDRDKTQYEVLDDVGQVLVDGHRQRLAQQVDQVMLFEWSFDEE